MAGREVREYTNLSDPKDKKWGKGKDKIDDEDITFQRMVAKMQEVAGERGGYLHGRGALDSDDLLYLKEQMEAEEDAERLLRRTEKRAFAAFKISFLFYMLYFCSLTNGYKAASLADSSPASVPLPLRVEPKPRSGIRQQDLLKKVLEVKPKKPRVSTPSDGNQPKAISSNSAANNIKPEVDQVKKKEQTTSKSDKPGGQNEVEKPVKSLLGLAYASSDDED
ncbi:ankyrin repeat protein [Citrus sinensis]|nr:ankyrin repeat protein [Citrus sinensis]